MASLFFNQPDLTAEEFLRGYWQKRPLLLAQAFPEFAPELDADDIAGLACDELAESRLITGSYPDQDWTVRYGPFSDTDFAGLPERDWTLLVQDVEKHYPPLRALLTFFDFIPQWRVDDLMVSVAGPGGSVGPHVDQYDVFLLQASGSRRWEIARSFDDTLLAGSELNVLNQFKAEQSWLLHPGDMLYLPPGVAHHGVALPPAGAERTPGAEQIPCMTWSIGMRAPSAADLLQGLGEWVAEMPDEGGRYRDPDLDAPKRSGEIDHAAVRRARRLVRSISENEELFATFLGSFLSRFRLAHDPAPPDRQIGPAYLQAALSRGATLHHNPWTRLGWMETAQGARLFAGGTSFPCSAELAMTISNSEALQTAQKGLSSADLELICELINRGHLILEPL